MNIPLLLNYTLYNYVVKYFRQILFLQNFQNNNRQSIA